MSCTLGICQPCEGVGSAESHVIIMGVVRSGKPITKCICTCTCVLSQELFELSLVLDVLYTWYLPTM